MEPGAKTRVVSNGTDALALLITGIGAGGGLEHEGLLCDVAGDRITLGVPGKAPRQPGR